MDINSVQPGQGVQYHQKEQPKLEQTDANTAVNQSATIRAYQMQAQQVKKVDDSIDLKTSNILKNLDTVKQIEQMQSRLNDLVKGVRKTNEGLNNAADQTVKMQDNLNNVVKNYPPFPADSPERKNLLMSYSSLRKEIESLMVPPPPPPVYEKVKSMWEGLFQDTGKILSSAVPAVAPDASNNEIQAASETLGKTAVNLSSMSDAVTQALIS